MAAVLSHPLVSTATIEETRPSFNEGCFCGVGSEEASYAHQVSKCAHPARCLNPHPVKASQALTVDGGNGGRQLVEYGRDHLLQAAYRNAPEDSMNNIHGLGEPSVLVPPSMKMNEDSTKDEVLGQQKNVSNSQLGQAEVTEPASKLSSAKLRDLTSSPMTSSTHPSSDELTDSSVQTRKRTLNSRDKWAVPQTSGRQLQIGKMKRMKDRSQSTSTDATPTIALEQNPKFSQIYSDQDEPGASRSHSGARSVSTPLSRRKISSSKINGAMRAQPSNSAKQSKVHPPPLRFEESKAAGRLPAIETPEPSPMPSSIPVPPLSLPTYLQLELSIHRPSPLYIHRSHTSDFPYESSRVKIERLQNFLLLPPQLEQVLWFGALACLDAWLYSFTILPLRFLKALSILGHSWGTNFAKEFRFVAASVYAGAGRMWYRGRRRGESINGSAIHNSVGDPTTTKVPADSRSEPKPAVEEDESGSQSHPDLTQRSRRDFNQRHGRTNSTPSNLRPDHKADILKGLLIIISCVILMHFDASRMYHGIRGQAAIKLYVIYNVLEVCDRLFSALGQDILECLFSKETLERKPDGHSKVLRPFWLFSLALCYNLVHATALFYQVITLNVAVNSYSNALLTLLMSNQFVEIKSTVFKKFEKENLFQLTCADVVERFQLWLMLTIIACRNIIETGGLTVGSANGSEGGDATTASSLGGSSILPKSFTMFPQWSGQFMGPFFLVLGSEMLVDWLKHAYVTKFNNTKPAIYGRFLDVLAKDYYSNAFADQNLTRRLGLPVIPLACLFIRASVQTYHMFLATRMPLPLPSTATSLSVDSATTSPATTAALQHIDQIFRRALGRSAFGAGGPTLSLEGSKIWSTDDFIAFVTMLVFFLVLFLALLAFKLVLGMCLLSFARRRYEGMKQRESSSVHADGRRIGGWGMVEVDEDKRRWIYNDDPEGAKKLRERERDVREKEKQRGGRGDSFGSVSRYNMVAKRIW